LVNSWFYYYLGGLQLTLRNWLGIPLIGWSLLGFQKVGKLDFVKEELLYQFWKGI